MEIRCLAWHKPRRNYYLTRSVRAGQVAGRTGWLWSLQSNNNLDQAEGRQEGGGEERRVTRTFQKKSMISGWEQFVLARLQCYMTNDLQVSLQSNLGPPFLRHPAELISILTSVPPITPHHLNTSYPVSLVGFSSPGVFYLIVCLVDRWRFRRCRIFI